MNKINFQNGKEGKTPLNKTNMNLLQDNVENEFKRLANALSNNKETVTGETIDLTDSAEERIYEFNVRGNSRQETREGFNLLNLENLKTITTQGVTVTNNKDGSFTLNGTSINSYGFTVAINNPKTLKTNTDYTIRTMHSGSATSYSGSLIGLRQEEGINLITKNFTDGKTTYTPTEDVIINYVRIYFDGGVTFTNLTIYPMLYEGTVEKDFEQYGATPSPDYPSEVESCGDNVNLFDMPESAASNGITLTKNEDGTANIKGKSTATAYFTKFAKIEDINLKAGKTYPLVSSTNNTNISYRIEAYNETTWISTLLSNTNNSAEITIPENTTQIRYYVSVASDLTVDYSKVYIKLEKGSKATPYSPYGQGCINEVVCNKNLFDKNKINEDRFINANGTIATQEGIFYSDYIYVKENEYINISGRNDWKSFGLYDKDKNFIKREALVGDNTSYLIPSGCKYIRINGEIANKDVIQVEQGSTVTQYIPHQSQTFTIPTQQPMRAIGDIRDTFVKVDGKWFERHNVKRYIFTGNETIAILNPSQNPELNVFYTNSNLVSGFQGNDGIIKYTCNCFKSVTVNDRYKEDNTLFINSSNMISFVAKQYSTIDEFKTYLQAQYNAGTPVYVDYILSTPTDIECTPEQSAILNEIDYTAKTYKGVTHSYSTDNVGAYKEIRYIKDIEIMMNN